MTPQTLLHSYELHLQAVGRSRDRNKVAIFDVLAEAGIAFIDVYFDGADGDYELGCRMPRAEGRRLDLPPRNIAIENVPPGLNAAEQVEMKLVDAIEMLSLAYLEEEYPDWADDEGSFGELVFDVVRQKVSGAPEGDVVLLPTIPDIAPLRAHVLARPQSGDSVGRGVDVIATRYLLRGRHTLLNGHSLSPCDPANRNFQPWWTPSARLAEPGDFLHIPLHSYTGQVKLLCFFNGFKNPLPDSKPDRSYLSLSHYSIKPSA